METTVIEAPKRFSLNLKELWLYRELLYFFTWRDIKVKYKQTVLGLAWAVLQPLALTILFTFLFAPRLGVQAGPIPYTLFVLSGLLLWNLFFSSVSHAAESIIQQAGILKKIYFPRLLIPLSALLTAMVDFAVVLLVFIGYCFFSGNLPNANAFIFFPLAIVFTLLAALGIGTLFAALNVQFRDFRYLLPFALQFLFFATQVLHATGKIVYKPLFYFLSLNPVNAAIELFRYPFTGTLDVEVVLIGAASIILFILAGISYFKKTEAFFADRA